MEGVGSLMLPNSLKAPLERLELIGNSTQGENPAPDNLQEIKSAGKWNKEKQKHEIDVKVTGKNLFPYSNDFSNWKKYVNNSYFGSVTSDESGIKAEALKPYVKIVSPTFKLKPITEYTISAMIDTKDKSMSLGVRIFKNLNVSDYLKQIVFARRKSTNNPQKVSATFITDDLKDTNEVYLQLDCSWGDSVLPTIVTFYDIQLELGNNATNYEPYTEQTVQIALDEPLRGIKRITDGKNVQEALNSSGITRCFKRVEITKDTLITYTLGQYGAPETNTVLCRYKDTSLKKAGVILCGELKNINNWVKEEESVSMTEQGIDFRLSRERLGLGSDTTPEENRVAVIKYLENHPLHCIAELNEPITEPLPESVQQQLQALHSENGTTHVFVDSGEVPCGIKLTYRKEK